MRNVRKLPDEGRRPRGVLSILLLLAGDKIGLSRLV